MTSTTTVTTFVMGAGGFIADTGKRLVGTEPGWAQALLRVTLAAALLPHGAQHLLGWFGGFGFAGTLGWMTDSLGIPAPLAAAGIVLEFLGPVALVLGLGSRAFGVALAVFMSVAASTHAANGFFMNWFGTLPSGVEGFEYHLLTVAIALAVAARGAGSASVDRWLTRRWQLEEVTSSPVSWRPDERTTVPTTAASVTHQSAADNLFV